MKRCIVPLIAIALLFAPALAQALIPPMEEGELERDADLIAVVRVLAVDPEGAMTEDHCYGWQTYRARVQIEQTIKGQAEGKEIVIFYRMRVKSEKKCVGGANSYHLSKDSRYKLFLQRSIDQKTKKVTYHFFHWQCIASA